MTESPSDLPRDFPPPVPNPIPAPPFIDPLHVLTQPDLISEILKALFQDPSFPPFLANSLRLTLLKKRPILFSCLPLPWSLIISLLLQAIQFFFLSKHKEFSSYQDLDSSSKSFDRELYQVMVSLTTNADVAKYSKPRS